jgi:hypothetical protein
MLYVNRLSFAAIKSIPNKISFLGGGEVTGRGVNMMGEI